MKSRPMTQPRLVLVAVVVGLTLGLDWTNAQQNNSSTLSSQKPNQKTSTPKSGRQQVKPNTSAAVKPPAVKSTATKPPAVVAPARINELFEFVNQHHPEIRPLLRSLQKNKRAQFQSAMRSLDREVRALQTQKEKSPQRYQRSLEMWITKSKTKLIAAQMAVKKSDKQLTKMQQEMKKLLNRHYELRAAQLRADISTMESRTKRLKQQLENLDKEKEREIKKQIETLSKSAQRIKKGRSSQPRGPAKVKQSDGN